MFYKKRLTTKQVNYYKISFSAFSKGMNTNVDDSLMSHKNAKLSYNFRVNSGALCDGIGFEALKLPKSYDDVSIEREILFATNEDIKNIWLYKCYNQETKKPEFKLQYFSNDTIYYSIITSTQPYLNELASIYYSDSVPEALNYRLNGEDSMIYSSKSEGMWVYREGYTAYKVDDALTFKSMCIHYERMFAILENDERNRLSFSDDLDPTNWSESIEEGGFIDMIDERGCLGKVLSFNDYVYVFRDFGVARVSAYGDQTNFSVSQLFVSGSKIYSNSVCVCGNKIMLLNSEGIHYFDGYSTQKINLGIDELFAGVNNENCHGIYAANKYYLALRLNFGDDEQIGCEAYEDGYINNALIEFDLDTNEITVCRGVDIRKLLFLDDPHFSKILACFNGEHCYRVGQMTNDGKIFGTPLCKKWVSPKSNIGFQTKTKYVKQFYVKTDSDCKVKFDTDMHSREYSVKGSSKTQLIKTDVHGEQLQISFTHECGDKCKISLPEIVVGVCS